MIPDEFLSSCKQSIQLARDRRRAAKSLSLASKLDTRVSAEQSTKLGSGNYSQSLIYQQS